jgi:hypothetical protein
MRASYPRPTGPRRLPHIAIDNEARGKLRVWKQQLARHYAMLEKRFRSEDILKTCVAFALRGSAIGRKRAFDKLSKAFTGCTLECVRLDGPNPWALWSVLKPRTSVAVNEGPELSQDCVAVHFILAGKLPNDDAFCSGMWTLEVPDHALGRLFQRSGGADPAACIMEAHHVLLRLRMKDVVTDGLTFSVRAGPGAFHSRLLVGTDDDDQGLIVSARTWVADGQLFDNQVVHVGEGKPGERLGDTYLLPLPLRWGMMDPDGTARVEVWEPARVIPPPVVEPLK